MFVEPKDYICQGKWIDATEFDGMRQESKICHRNYTSDYSLGILRGNTVLRRVAPKISAFFDILKI